MDLSPLDVAQILHQLAAIKIAVYIMVGVSTITMLFVTIRFFLFVRQLVKKELGDMFRNHGQDLFDAGSIDDLIALAQEQIRSRPNDSYAHWYLARGYYQKESWAEALEVLNRLSRLEPRWIDDYVKPYVEAIKRRVKADAPQ